MQVLHLIVAIALLAAAHVASSATISVDPSTAITNATITQLSTQIVYHNIIEGVANGQSRLNALKMPLMRIHAGADGTYTGFGPTLPAGVTQGAWSFVELDQIVNNIRTAGAVPVLNIRYPP